MRCAGCAKSAILSNRKNWCRRVIQDCLQKDREKTWDEPWDTADYITKEWVKAYYDEHGPRCFWCDKECRIVERRGVDGLQCERLNNKVPHLRSNCVMCCGGCNRASHQASFNRMPAKVDQYITQYNQPMQWSAQHARLQALLCLELTHLSDRSLP